MKQSFGDVPSLKLGPARAQMRKPREERDVKSLRSLLLFLGMLKVFVLEAVRWGDESNPDQR